jgi:membrane peptidoglycan carboxypeptidase
MDEIGNNPTPKQKLPLITFPKKERYYFDNPEIAETKNQLVPVISSKSKVGTGMKTKLYTPKDILDDQKQVGQKQSNKYQEGVRRYKTFFMMPLEGFGRRISVGFLFFLVVIIILNGFLIGFVVDLWASSPSLDQFLKRPIESSIVYARDGKTKIYEFYKEERREFVEISKIPKVMQLAVIALEDENFYKNETGIPWKNMVGALQKCLTSGGENCRGGSGLTQQLVKVMTNKKEVTTDRKLRELIAALKLNQETNHTEVLEAYLNWIPFGRNSYGVQQASKSYFGREISEKVNNQFVLSDVEACFLATMIQSPGYYPTGIGKPDSDAWKALIARKDACLFKLRQVELPTDENGTISTWIKSDEDLTKLQNQPIEASENKLAQELRKQGKIAIVKQTTDDPFPHFREYVTNELIKMYDEQTLYEGGLRVVTTIDPDIQNKTQQIVTSSEQKLKAVGANNAAAMVLDGPNGEILAMVGSLGYDRDDIDGKVNITTTPQQPGSSVKPYVYANAWQNGYNPSTQIADYKTYWGEYSPENFSGYFNGVVSMRYAIQNSLNVPSVKAILLGAKEKSITGYANKPDSDYEQIMNGFFNFVEKAGVRFPCQPSGDGAKCSDPKISKNAYRDRCGLSSALGGCEVTMVSHATGINTLLQEGNLRTATPFLSIKVKDQEGKEAEIYTSKQKSSYPKQDSIIDPLIAKQVTNVMTDYNARIPEFGDLRFNLELKNKDWKVAAKTGTSNGPKDFWVVGGTPYYTVTIWAGRNDNKDMSKDSSSSASSAFIWNQIMEAVHKDKTVKNFSTTGLEKTEVRTGVFELLTPSQRIFLREKGGVVVPPKL